MPVQRINFAGTIVPFFFHDSNRNLKQILQNEHAVFLTDENVFAAHPQIFKNRNPIVIKAGEKYKVQATADKVLRKLIEMGAHRKSILVGVGGGVITDLTGYVASLYMRGIRFGLVPSTLLALVDASIGGKNGIDIGPYKNMAGTIKQPDFIFHDLKLLKTLPDAEWQNGFAEIIKHGCVADAALFRQLEENDLSFYKKKPKELATLVKRNALLKSRMVRKDISETGERKLLNYGHTLGHAIETLNHLSHGEAISIGMVFASKVSKLRHGFRHESRIRNLLEKYQLPTHARINTDKVFRILTKDKKAGGDFIDFIILNRIGKAQVERIGLEQLKAYLNESAG